MFNSSQICRHCTSRPSATPDFRYSTAGSAKCRDGKVRLKKCVFLYEDPGDVEFLQCHERTEIFGSSFFLRTCFQVGRMMMMGGFCGVGTPATC